MSEQFSPAEDPDSPQNALRFGGDAQVPASVATCPECGGRLHVEVNEWASDTGSPAISGLYVDCESDPDCKHRHYQSDWQPVIDRVAVWCGAVTV